MVDTPELVWHTTTGSVAVTIGPEQWSGCPTCSTSSTSRDPEAFVVEVVVCASDGSSNSSLFELGPDDPHAASTSAPTAPSGQPPTHANPPTPDHIRPLGHPYASTVRSASTSAKRRCASARRVGMCSVGTSCGVYPFSTRRATVWRCTSSGPS